MQNRDFVAKNVAHIGIGSQVVNVILPDILAHIPASFNCGIASGFAGGLTCPTQMCHITMFVSR